MYRVTLERSAVQSAFAWTALIVLVVSLSACAPRRYVYLPPDYQTSQPPPQPSTAKPNLPKQKSGPPELPQGKGPIIKRTPEFKEMDLPKGAEAPAPPVLQKSAEPQVQLPTQPPAQPPTQPPQFQQPPQHLASMHLVEQARTALGQGRPDAAIPLLEQAIQVDVYNGEAFWGLAKAWRMKGSQKKSLEFARKTEILFQNERGKLKEVYLFEASLYKEMGDPKKAESYRQKASKL